MPDPSLSGVLQLKNRSYFQNNILSFFGVDLCWVVIIVIDKLNSRFIDSLIFWNKLKLNVDEFWNATERSDHLSNKLHNHRFLQSWTRFAPSFVWRQRQRAPRGVKGGWRSPLQLENNNILGKMCTMYITNRLCSLYFNIVIVQSILSRIFNEAEEGSDKEP